MPYADPEQQKQAQREWYQANKEKTSARSKAQRLARQAVVNKYKDVPCLDCGVQYPTPVMHLHCPDPSGHSSMNLSKMVRNFASITEIEEEAAKCVPLCSNCHVLRHIADGSHGRNKNSP